MGAVSIGDICHSNAVTPACPNIQCTTLLSGWSGAACHRYGTDHPGYCLTNSTVAGLCSSDASFCATLPSQDTVAAAGCGSVECRKSGACVRGSAASSATNVASVCQVSSVEMACNDIPCQSLLFGWNGRACERFEQPHPGYCDASAKCSAAQQRCVDDVAVTRKTPLFTCGSLQCRKLDQCQQLSSVPAQSSDVCLTNVESNNCPEIPCTNIVKGW